MLAFLVANIKPIIEKDSDVRINDVYLEHDQLDTKYNISSADDLDFRVSHYQYVNWSKFIPIENYQNYFNIIGVNNLLH